MDVKVSVVVPIRNPGSTADACIRSVLEQSMAPEEYEVIFADDGSDDGIQQRLDIIASGRPNVQVLHLTPTGSPMRGRNIGMAVAKGDYVYLMEQTDRLERVALERMYLRAVETDADILIGRLVNDQGPPSTVFEGNRDRADILRDRLLSLLTPHKLYRRSFLDAEALNFADPGGRLAEQAFVMRAYLRAKVIAIMADQVCCHVDERPEPPINPYVWGAELRELLDIIDFEVPEGRQRDRMYAHWFRTSVLRPLGGSRFLSISSKERAATFTTLRELVVQRFPQRLDHHLPVHLRARAALLRAGRLDQLIVLAEAMRGTHLRADLRKVLWDGGVLTMELTVELMRASGDPMRFRPYGEDGLLWEPPVPLDGLRLPPELADVSQAAVRARFEVYIRHEETGLVYFLPVKCAMARSRHRNGIRLQVTGTARLDVASAALGRALPAGLWEIHVRMYSGANQARTRVTGSPLNCIGELADYSQRLVIPWWSDKGELGICVEPRSLPESIVLVSPGTTVTRQRKHVFVVVPVPYVPPSGGPVAELVLRRERKEREVSVPALVEPGVPGQLAGRLIAKVQTRLARREGFLCPGDWSPFLRMDDKEVGLRFKLRMGRGGRVQIRESAAATRSESRYTLLKRVALRIPGVRNAVKATRTVQRRYLPS
ncbi:glycosyltransferase family 2 protein [Streptosporangium sp. NPDC000396]|uniref:glycosyltransferase family 2 protein n=1 Tax=Streptosporangium sp. NPDC000396 TaxID=3366185 RepID=UPI0036BB66E3